MNIKEHGDELDNPGARRYSATSLSSQAARAQIPDSVRVNLSQ